MTNCPITIPAHVAKLPKDHRGYPVPYVVQRDQKGQPLFIVNDTAKVAHCIRRKLCAICGERLPKQLWFVGGPRSAFDPHGAYRDPAMHQECMHYALQSCPYLSGANYHPVDLEAVTPKLEARVGDSVLLYDPTQDPTRPKLFVAVMAYGQSLTGSPLEGWYLHPLRPYHAVEYWRDGRQIGADEALSVIRRIPELDLSALRLVERVERSTSSK